MCSEVIYLQRDTFKPGQRKPVKLWGSNRKGTVPMKLSFSFWDQKLQLIGPENTRGSVGLDQVKEREQDHSNKVFSFLKINSKSQ